MSLYNDNSEEVRELDELLSRRDPQFFLTSYDLSVAMKSLKNKSAPDHDGIFSNHLKLAPASFFAKLLCFLI